VTEKKRWPRVGLLAAVVVVIAGFAYLLTGGISSNLVFFLTPGELLARGTEIVEKPVRLGGQVVPNSVEWNAEAIDLRFKVQDETGKVIVVHATKAPPAMFRAGIGVVLEGKLNRSGVFESSNLMVKHSNEYRPPEDGQHDTKAMYESLIKGGQT
jgi:cytochrome c-type biogenesis protein CcmE